MKEPSTQAQNIAERIRKESQNPAFNIDICLGAMFAIKHFCTDQTNLYQNVQPSKWNNCLSYWEATEQLTIQLLQQ